MKMVELFVKQFGMMMIGSARTGREKMANIEKVIKGLECCQNPTESGLTCECIDCPYEQGYKSKCRVMLKIDTIELLKEQKSTIDKLNDALSEERI